MVVEIEQEDGGGGENNKDKVDEDNKVQEGKVNDDKKGEEGDVNDNNMMKEGEGKDDKKKKEEGDDEGARNLNGTSPENYKKQPNGYDCGVYVCCLYDYIANKVGLPVTQIDCFQRRNWIAGCIASRCITNIESASADSEVVPNSNELGNSGGNNSKTLELANALAAAHELSENSWW